MKGDLDWPKLLVFSIMLLVGIAIWAGIVSLLVRVIFT